MALDGIYYCPHGYARGVCGVCTDPDHNCQAPRLKKQVARLKAENEKLQRATENLRRALLHYGSCNNQCNAIDCPHLHRGVECDQRHPCDCGWTEMGVGLLRAPRK